MRRAATLLAPLLAIAGCGSGDDGSLDDGSILATTTIWADIASNVLCGEPVDALMPAGADPHVFEPSLRDRERLEDASAVIANGAGLEESLLDLLETVAAGGTDVVEMANFVDVIADDDDDHDDHDDDVHDDENHDDEAVANGEDEHRHGDGDPHIWLDPRRVSGALDVIADVAVAHGADAEAIAACLTDYREELATVDAEVEATLAAIPSSARVFVTNHDDLTYFADRYGLTIVGTVIPSSSSIAETDAATIAELSDSIEQAGVRTIFADAFESRADAEAVADDLGLRVVSLTTGSLTEEGDSSTYIGLLRELARDVSEALTP